MRYNNETRLAKSNENKNKIIEVALKLINEKGFDNVSVSEITKEAGVSKGAFYIHFESKDASKIEDKKYPFPSLCDSPALRGIKDAPGE